MSAEQISTLPGGELQDFLQYIREIQEYPLLSQQQEIDLAMSIESGVEAMQTMVAANDLSEFSVEDLAFRIRAGEEARTTFINSNLRLVIAYAKKIHSNTMNLQDKIQEGNIILIRAVEDFDYRQGHRFTTFAVSRLSREIKKKIKQQDRAIRVTFHGYDKIRQYTTAQTDLQTKLQRLPTDAEVSDYLGIDATDIAERKDAIEKMWTTSINAPVYKDGQSRDLTESIADVSEPPVELKALDQISKRVVFEWLETKLEERERQIIKLRYGIDQPGPKTLEEVGAEFNLTRERIRQIEVKALNKLRKPSNEHYRDLLAS
jgi:RNA polymerase primary sigma factor